MRDRTMMSLHNVQPSTQRTGVDHIAFKIDNWDTDRVKAELERLELKARSVQNRGNASWLNSS